MLDRWHDVPEENWTRARQMRHEPTPAERRLWAALRNRQLGVQFRRRHPLGFYIADFCAADAKLVIELDGDIHELADQKERDLVREQWLRDQGYTVLRYQNEDVLNRLRVVLEDIRKHLR